MTLKVLPWPLHVMDTHTNRSAHMYTPQEYWMGEISWGNVQEGLDGTMHLQSEVTSVSRSTGEFRKKNRVRR